MRELVTLECATCRRRNYSHFKNKQANTDRLSLKKFCRFCRAHTPHKETK